jgi:hypothetical protein
MPTLDGTGLEAWRCVLCGHRGFTPSEGLRALFTGHHEHVYAYGPSPLTLKVVFSDAALALFRDRALRPADAAQMTVRWALLIGQIAGTVSMFLEGSIVARCYEYFTAHEGRGSEACIKGLGESRTIEQDCVARALYPAVLRP